MLVMIIIIIIIACYLYVHLAGAALNMYARSNGRHQCKYITLAVENGYCIDHYLQSKKQKEKPPLKFKRVMTRKERCAVLYSIPGLVENVECTCIIWIRLSW